jgi:shikimate dehydrogenase
MTLTQFGLIGNPLSHSFSGKYFNTKFEKEKLIDHKFHLFELLNLKDFKSFLSSIENLKGLSVTIPYKQQVIPFLDYLDMEALKIGAVNCIKIEKRDNKVFLSGFNTDVYGFEHSIKPLISPYYKKAMILGTGGASKAVAFVFDKLGIEYVFVSRSPNACKQIRYQILNKEIINTHTIIVNTTPLGMFPNLDEAPDIPYEFITSKHLLFDLTYNPEETIFLKKGKEKGASIKNGLEMLHWQAEKAWKIWNS